MDCSPPGSSAHGILQARVLEWGAIAFSGNLVQDQVFCNSAMLSQIWPTLSLWGSSKDCSSSSFCRILLPASLSPKPGTLAPMVKVAGPSCTLHHQMWSRWGKVQVLFCPCRLQFIHAFPYVTPSFPSWLLALLTSYPH